MATIIEVGEGRFIVGDPAEALPPGYAWCTSCLGTGLDYGYDFDDELCVCYPCNGSGVGYRLHPLVPVRPPS